MLYTINEIMTHFHGELASKAPNVACSSPMNTRQPSAQGAACGPDGTAERLDALIVMGSRNCDYKAKRALKIGAGNPGMAYIVSGGNPYHDGERTEAEFMASYLREHGVANESIYIENRARYTKQNLSLSIAVVTVYRLSG